MNALTHDQIRQYLPHRYPFLLVDKVTDIESGVSLTAVKNVTANEPYFIGHFPRRPVMPGVLMVEALAQASGILIYFSAGRLPQAHELVYLAGIDEVRFKHIVVPGDQLGLHVEIIKERTNFWKFKGTATVDDEVACQAVFMNIKAPDISEDAKA